MTPTVLTGQQMAQVLGISPCTLRVLAKTYDLNQGMAGMMGNMMQGMNQQTPPPAPGMTPSPPPAVQYNVAVNGQSTGPFTLAQLAQMAQTGQFTPQSQVWKQGMSGWATAGTVQELASVFAQNTPPPAPPVQ